MANPAFDPETLAIGTLGRPHGLAGDLTVRPHNVASAALTAAGGAAIRSMAHLFLERAAGVREEWAVDSLRRAGQNWILHLHGIDTREAAEALTNAVVRIHRKYLPPLDAGEFFVEDLIGCAVVNQTGDTIGQVGSLFWNGAQDIIVVRASSEEIMIPVVPAFVLAVDTLARRVVVDWTTDD